MKVYYFLRGFVLVLVGVLIYGQTFGYDFVFDDYLFIVTNPFIKNFSNIHVMWHAFPMTRFIGMYSFAFNYHLGQLHPQGYHIFNFIVHLINVALVWALADLLFKIAKILPSQDRWTKELPFIIAFIFLVHPGQTQAVTYITQRFESMATLFYLATIYVYLHARLATGWGSKFVLLCATGVLTLLGILTKEVAITIPAMIWSIEWIFFPKDSNKKLYLVFAIIGVVLYFLFSKMVHTDLSVFRRTFTSESHDGDLLTPFKYFLTQGRVFLTFLRLLILPIHQNLDYDYPASIGIFSPPLTFIGFTGIGLFVYSIISLRRQFPLIAFGMAWILITFSINWVPRSNVIFEHKLYLISFGFFLSFVLTLSHWVRDRSTLFRIFGCVIIVLAFVSFQRNKVWSNEVKLWEDIIKNSPNKARVNANLGRVYGTQGRLDDSIHYFTRAIAISPDNISYENRGVIYAQLGRVSEALADLDRSVAMDPNYFSVYVKRAWVYQTQHQDEAALVDLARAIALEPYFADAYIQRGILWMQRGKLQEALNDFQMALKIDPLNYDVLLKRGYVYFSLNQFDLALADFNRAQALEPTSKEAKQYLEYCLAKLGRY